MGRGRPPKFPNSRGEWQCSNCRKWQPVHMYYKNGRARNGLSSQCKSCMNQYQRDTYAVNRLKRQTLELSEYWPSAPENELANLAQLWFERAGLASDPDADHKDQVLELTKRIELVEMTFTMQGYDRPIGHGKW